ncbi:hypothetical protein [Nocardia sp. NPDC051750]|uniref:hypothetical protein n=1 Tax=Nocardia sp. NPDC051750 TaxID=3364325 RepID=UPI0037A2C445
MRPAVQQDERGAGAGDRDGEFDGVRRYSMWLVWGIDRHGCLLGYHYGLTELGRSLEERLAGLREWAETHMSATADHRAGAAEGNCRTG